MEWERKARKCLQVESFKAKCFNAADQMLVERASYANEGYYFFLQNQCLNLYQRKKNKNK